MKRKIVQHGSSSLTITLPVKWVQKYSITKGSELNIEESGPSLIITTDKETHSPKKELTETNNGKFTKNDLSHLYQLGYDEVIINYSDNATLEAIRKRVNECIGYEIIDQKNGKVYIKSIAGTLESEFDNLLRKSFMITNELAKGIHEALEKKEYTKLSELRHMENINNKFTDVCLRILSKRGYKVPNRTMQAYEVVKNIERIADEYKYICDLYSEQKKVSMEKKSDIPKEKKFILNKEHLLLYKEVMQYYLLFYDLFYNYSAQTKSAIYNERNALMKKLMVTLEKSNGKESLFIHYLVNIVQKSYEGAGGYFCLTL